MDNMVQLFLEQQPGQLVPNLGTLTQEKIPNTDVPCFNIAETKSFTVLLHRWLLTIGAMVTSAVGDEIAAVTSASSTLELNVLVTQNPYQLMRYGTVGPLSDIGNRLNVIVGALIPVRP